MTKRVQVLAVMAVVALGMQVSACADQPSTDTMAEGPAQLLAPSLAEVDGSRIRSAATVTLLNVSGTTPTVLARESMPVEGIIRNGTAMGDIRLGRGAKASVERIPLVRSRAKRRTFSESETDEAGRDFSVMVEELPSGASRTEIWRDFELLARITYEYRGTSGQVRQIVQESFVKGKATTRLEIAMNDHRVVDAGDADATAQVVAGEVEHASVVGSTEAIENGQFMPVAAAGGRGCYWRTLALLAEAATVGAACGAAITTAIVTAGVSVTACVFGGGHLLAALEDWQEDCAPAAT